MIIDRWINFEWNTYNSNLWKSDIPRYDEWIHSILISLHSSRHLNFIACQIQPDGHVLSQILTKLSSLAFVIAWNTFLEPLSVDLNTICTILFWLTSLVCESFSLNISLTSALLAVHKLTDWLNSQICKQNKHYNEKLVLLLAWLVYQDEQSLATTMILLFLCQHIQNWCHYE